MSPLFFPDNTVLVNFALINRVDLLERLANSNGQWCASVEMECVKSAKIPGLEALTDVPAIFGEPLRPTAVEHSDARLIRDDLARPGDLRQQHLGEAETLAIITRRQINGIFVTDDSSARTVAARYGVRTASTWELLRLATRVGFIDADTAWATCRLLAVKDEGARQRSDTARVSTLGSSSRSRSLPIPR